MQQQAKLKKVQHLNTAVVNMQRQSKESKICKSATLQMAICTDEENKVKHAELNYCRCQY